MTPAELQKILRSDEKLTVKQVKEIIWELKQDCFDKIYEMYGKGKLIGELIVDQKYYQGESNAFYICLDLLEKVEEDDE